MFLKDSKYFQQYNFPKDFDLLKMIISLEPAQKIFNNHLKEFGQIIFMLDATHPDYVVKASESYEKKRKINLTEYKNYYLQIHKSNDGITEDLNIIIPKTDIILDGIHDLKIHLSSILNKPIANEKNQTVLMINNPRFSWVTHKHKHKEIIHVPLITNPNNIFWWEDEQSLQYKTHLELGYAYKVKTDVMHNTFNYDHYLTRIHLMMNIND